MHLLDNEVFYKGLIFGEVCVFLLVYSYVAVCMFCAARCVIIIASICYLLIIRLMEWKRLHNEELNDLYSSPNIVRVIKSRRMRWAGHVAGMGEEKGGV